MKKLIIILGVSIITMAAMSGLMAEQEKQPETMPLVPMMQELLTSIQTVDQGIYNENYALIEKGAEAIAEHPSMTPEDKKLIKETLGEEMQTFVAFDMTVHHHADSMRMAAMKEDMHQVLRHYTIVQNGCVDCHSNYRDPVMEARVGNNDK